MFGPFVARVFRCKHPWLGEELQHEGIEVHGRAEAVVVKQREEGIPADELVRRVTMEQSSAFGLNSAKFFFQAHGVNAPGDDVLRRRLTRSQLHKLFEKLAPCLGGMEACASARPAARELAALGREFKLMPPQCPQCSPMLNATRPMLPTPR